MRRSGRCACRDTSAEVEEFEHLLSNIEEPEPWRLGDQFPGHEGLQQFCPHSHRRRSFPREPGQNAQKVIFARRLVYEAQVAEAIEAVTVEWCHQNFIASFDLKRGWQLDPV